jgi:hypothetical protein
VVRHGQPLGVLDHVLYSDCEAGFDDTPRDPLLQLPRQGSVMQDRAFVGHLQPVRALACAVHDQRVQLAGPAVARRGRPRGHRLTVNGYYKAELIRGPVHTGYLLGRPLRGAPLELEARRTPGNEQVDGRHPPH